MRSPRSLNKQPTHESILGAHRGIVCLGRRNDVKVADDGGDHHPKDNVSKILPAAESAASPKRHQMLVHQGQLGGVSMGFEPAIG